MCGDDTRRLANAMAITEATMPAARPINVFDEGQGQPQQQAGYEGGSYLPAATGAKPMYPQSMRAELK